MPPPPCPAPTCACAPRSGARTRAPPTPIVWVPLTTYFTVLKPCDPGDLSPASLWPGIPARPAFQPAVVPVEFPGLSACAPGRHQETDSARVPRSLPSPSSRARARPPRDRAVTATARAQLQ